VTTRVALLATYPPRRCGIATFTYDLRSALADSSGPRLELPVIAVDEADDNPTEYPSEVVRRLDGTDPGAYRELALDLTDWADIVLLQHEFGIFGGEWGRHILGFLDEVRVPVVATLHTVLAEPDPTQREILAAIFDRSARAVVMSPRGRRILMDQLAMSPDRIDHIPHGVPRIPATDARGMRRRLGLADSPTLLSFGLLGPGKRLELAITAFAAAAREVPDAQYVILGETHPGVRRTSGESYRESLRALADDLGVGDRTIFVDRFVDRDELVSWIQASDVFITAYAGAEQVASGTLSQAVAAGRACVSTPYLHARELLADGRGSLVPFEDAGAMAAAIASLLADPEARGKMGDAARAFSRRMTWPVVAAAYRQVLADVLLERQAQRIRYGRAVPPPKARAGKARPDGAPPNRQYLDRLRAPHGVWQHAHGLTPVRRHGTCTDDVARALLVDVAHGHVDPQPATMAAIRSDLTYLAEAFNVERGRFRNFRAADGTWLEQAGSEDAHGRALQALGSAIEQSSDAVVRRPARRLFMAALKAAQAFEYVRPRCYAALGMAAVWRADGDRVTRATLRQLMDGLWGDVARLDEIWPWPEAVLTYDNGVLPEALILAGAALGREEWVARGSTILQWLVEVETAPDGHLRPIGNQGWLRRGGEAAAYGQQPIEALSLLSAANAARQVTGEARWTPVMERAYAWFLGRNDLESPLAIPDIGACRDGLDAWGVSENCGAESTLAWLTAVEIVRNAGRLRDDGRSARRPQTIERAASTWFPAGASRR
jgi:glycosyltransferase involved in cell wall biosynthesis